ncbi:NAD(P)-dependent oxidoreductase [Mesorhizobium sp. B2-3-4]|uniref:NAD(P)-dependent oxidoreductase n=1 Tax=Mesorhizobium sp. B2-3-4 TaxID=2589959 RepID=UPI00112878F3|nr:NAD(P)-dependent oxidoreductase [Mesorhizobium sp. B2-3-4]TPM40483.1 NAD(P)-dependent oxidoreductase [Mesorhizobium sp. B2-3-4]
MSEAPRMGFIGLGHMGSAMAMNLANAGPLTVWNRSTAKTVALKRAGARVAASSDDLFASCDVIILMLSDGEAIDAVLDRSSSRFSTRVTGRVIVHMGTTSPDYSLSLECDIRAAGGAYVEAPVSGSRKPAEAGQLVAMLAGDPAAVAAARACLAPMCKSSITCGAVPKALLMKLAVNILLLATVTGLMESLHFAERGGLDLDQVVQVLAASQMASDISRLKAPKLVQGDFSAHATIADVLKNGRLISQAARSGGVASPVLDVCRDLYEETLALGHGDLDMIAVVKAIEARTDQNRKA